LNPNHPSIFETGGYGFSKSLSSLCPTFYSVAPQLSLLKNIFPVKLKRFKYFISYTPNTFEASLFPFLEKENIRNRKKTENQNDRDRNVRGKLLILYKMKD